MDLRLHLERQGDRRKLVQTTRAKKKYKKRYGSNDKRGKIKNKTTIKERPEVIDEKERIGD